MKNDFGGLILTEGDVTYVPHQNWRTDTLNVMVEIKIQILTCSWCNNQCCLPKNSSLTKVIKSKLLVQLCALDLVFIIELYYKKELPIISSL